MTKVKLELTQMQAESLYISAHRGLRDSYFQRIGAVLKGSKLRAAKTAMKKLGTLLRSLEESPCSTEQDSG